MRTLVTGHLGFIGGALSDFLETEKDFIVEKLELDEFFDQGKNSIDDLENLLDLMDPDVIFHVGACSDTLEKDVNYMMILNYESTKVICDWAKRKERRVIYSSSAASYGTNDKFPANIYGWSKYAGEGYVVSNGGIALRYFNVYGPGEEHKGRMSSVAYQMHLKKEKGEEIKLFPGEPKRDFVYIKDIISANMYAFENFESLKCKWYDVGYSEARTFEDVLSCMGISDFTYSEISEIPEGYQFYTRSKMLMPGWKPKYPIENGLEEYIRYLSNEQ